MIERILDFIIEILSDLKFWVVIPHYDMGIQLRLGKHYKTLSPGIHWKIPFVDQILTHMVKTKTINLNEQTLTTLDNKQIVIKAVIKYEVSNVEKLLLEVNDAPDAVSDMTQGIIRNVVITKNFDLLNDQDFSKEVLSKARIESERWGIKILAITITDLAQIRTIRLMQHL